MLDLRSISKMDVDEWNKYISELSTEDIIANLNILNMAHGFILCREVSKHKLPKEAVDEFFHSALLNGTINSLEKCL